MWNAKIESKTFEKGLLQIGVIFSNSEATFTEVFTVYSTDDLEAKISSRINQLNNLDLIEVSIGEYTVKPVKISLPDPKQEALNKLRETQDLVKLGVLKEDDKSVLDCIQTVKDLI